MPVALDPNEIFPYVILTDRAKPTEEQPTLLFHFPTVTETRRIANAFDAASAAFVTSFSEKGIMLNKGFF